jgi:hypothetical protein
MMYADGRVEQAARQVFGRLALIRVASALSDSVGA